MITKLNTKQLEEIIKIVIKHNDKFETWEDNLEFEYNFVEAKKEVAEYLQLPDLFNCE